MGPALFMGLGVGLVLLLWLREGSAAQSLAHAGQLVGLDRHYRARDTDAVLGWLTTAMGAGLLLTAVLGRLVRGNTRRLAVVARTLLLAMVVTSGAAWLYGARGVAQHHYVKLWDSFHYLLGPKYFDELGYFGLYDCVAAADAETVQRLRGRQVRDLRDYRRRLPVNDAIERARCQERFTPKRWEAFKHDYVFYAELSGRMIRRMVGDHGYNGTPTHAFLAGLIANAFELDYASAVFTTLIDSLALLAMFAALSYAFGWELAAICAVLFFTLFSDRGYFILGSFYRYQWLVFTGLGLAALKARRHALAGGMLAAAAMLNVFPVLFFGGVLARAAWRLVTLRSIDLAHRRLVTGAVATALVLAGLGLATGKGVGNYIDFIENMDQHSGLVTRSRIGLKYTLAYRGETDPSDYNLTYTTAELHRTKPIRIAIAVALLVALLLAARRFDDVQATVLAGVTAFFCLFGTVEYYYGIYALVPLVWHRGPLRGPPLAWLALPFIANAGAYLAYETTSTLGIANNFAMSFGIAAVLVVFLIVLPGSGVGDDGASRPVDEGHDRRWQRISAALLLGCAAAIVILPLIWLPPTTVKQVTGPVLAFGGDVNLGRRQQALSARDGYATALSDVASLREADLAVVNLECVVASRGDRRVDKGEFASYYFRARPETLAVLDEAGIDLVSTANNHSLDYGPDALLQQQAMLNNMGIGAPGAGASREEACAPVFRWVGDVAVAFFAFDSTQASFGAAPQGPGTCYFPLDASDEVRDFYEPRILAARRKAHLIMVMPHWGPNRRTRPGGDELSMGHALIAAGADAVLGTSAHVMQGVEVYRGKPIIHDAGDLLFDYTNRNEEGALYSLVLSPSGVRQIQVTPLVRRPGRTRVARGREAVRQLEIIRGRSMELGTHLIPKGERAFLDLNPEEPAAGRLPEPAPSNPLRNRAPSAETQPPAECVVEAVPEAAAIDPVQLGPFTLLGFRGVESRIDRRQDLWFEAYLTLAEPVEETYWLRLEGTPTRRRRRSTWRADHEPCDFQWPTDRWVPGIIYRDFYGVRPPDQLEDGVLRFGLSVLKNRRPIARHKAGPVVEVATGQSSR